MLKNIKNVVISAFLIVSLVSSSYIEAFAVGGAHDVFNGRVFVSDVKTQLAPGAVEHKITTNNTSGTDQNIDFVSEIDLSNTDTIKVMSCYAGYSTINGDNIDWQMMTLPEQAQRAQAYFNANQGKYPNYKIVGVLVGDTYNMGTGQPTHVLVIDGIAYQKAYGEYYFAIDNEGKAVIRNNTDTSDLSYAIGGMGRIVANGQNVSSKGNTYVDGSFSRAAVGIKEDGTVITFCTYGNSYPISCGYTWSEVADYMIAQGCVDALMLDGSGSAEWCARYEGTDSVQSVSHPSDGSSRAVGSCLLIVSTAEPDGTFARASITPDGSVYTPGSTVQFEAVGADNAGNAVEIPAEASWSLSDDRYGTIDSQGNFVSNGTCGDVTVNLNYNGNVYGSSTITIAAPDSITFSKASEDVGRGKSSNLGLQVRYQNRDVVLKDGDIAWTLTNDDVESGAAIGTIAFSDGEYLFTGNSSVTCSGTVKAEYSADKDIAGSIQVKVGTDPVKALDFEEPTDGTTLQQYYGLDNSGYVIGRINNGSTETATDGLLTRLYYGRGGNETAKIVSVSDGYPVHSGSNALQVNYDFSECAAGITEGANVGLTKAIDIPGHPTSIGLWVWVPENTPNLWLRVRLNIYNPNGALNTTTQFDFGPQINETFPKDGSYGGLTVCEEGTWYFCTADLSSYDGCTFQIPAGEAIRLMRTDGNDKLSYNGKSVTKSHGKYLRDGTEVNSSNLKGSVYFDDLMFIYGSVNEDTDAPIIKEATFNTTSNFYDGMTVTDNHGEYRFYIEDVKGNSGIDPVGLDADACYLYVDGECVNDRKTMYFDQGTSSIGIAFVDLANGEHSIRVLISDKNGNKSSKTYNFTVAGKNAQYPTYSLKTDAVFAPLGGSVPLTIHTTDASNIEKFTTTIQVNNRYKNGGYTITAADGFSYKEGSAKYDEVNNTVTFEVTADGSKTGACDLATIAFDIDKSLAAGSYFSYTVTAGIEKAKTGGEATTSDYHGGFSLPQARLQVEAPYTVSSDLLYQNMADPGYIYVKDTEGNAVAEIDIYRQDGTKLGTTNKDGKWQVSDALLASAQQLVVYASCDDGISFNETISIFGTNAKESPVIFTACGGNGTSKQLSWLSDIQKTVTFRYATAENDLTHATEITVNTRPVKFGGSSFSEAVTAQVNSVKLTGLTAGTYYYQYRYGEGEWTTANSFTVKETGGTTNFFVLGDVQAQDTSNIKAIIGNLNKADYAFGIQTGDLVDQAYSYSCWNEALTLMSGLDSKDMIYALGNHENNMGDDGSIAKEVYQMPSKDYYSVEYGNVYVANISYNSLDGYKKALEWLVEDAQASSAKWKIVTMHQPTYYTNSTATDNKGMDELTPSYLQAAGINMVFSGHDHSYARTAALIDGKRSESYDAENKTCNRGDGIVYYICGSSGEKSYPIDTTLPFDYTTKGDFNAIYLTVEAAKDKLTVNTYDLTDAKTGEAACIDTFTMYASACVTGKHSFNENSHYDMTTQTLTCSVCDEKVAASESGYTGVAKCGEEQVYLFNGIVQTGWVTVGEDIVHTGDDGILHNTLSFTTETCTKNGTRMAFCNECNMTKSYGTTVRYHNHSYDADYKCQNSYYDKDHKLHACGWTGVDINTLQATLAYKYGYYDGEGRRPKVTVKDADGNELLNQSTYGDYVAYYSDNADIGVATIRLVAYNSYYGEKTLHFEVRPSNVKTITLGETTENSVKLSWEKSLGAEKYAVYQASGSGWRKIADTTDLSYEVEGLAAGSTYKFCIRPYTIVEHTKQRLDGSYDEVYWSTQYSDEVSVTTRGTASGGGSASSGGSAAPTTDTTTDTTGDQKTDTGSTTETTPVATTTATVKAETKTAADGTTTTTATLDDTTATKIVEKAVENKSKEVVVNTATKTTVTETAAGTTTKVDLPEQAVKAIAEKTEASVTIKSDAAEVRLDAKTVKEVAKQAGNNGTVNLVVETVARNRTKVEVDLKLVTSKGTVSDFKGGNVSVTVKLNTKLAAKPVACVYIDDHGTYHKVKGAKNADGTYTFKTGHFSTYAVMAKADAEKVFTEQTANVEKLVKALSLGARAAKTGNGNIKVTLSPARGDSQAIEDLGYTVKYKFYRSTKQARGYKAKAEQAGKTYTDKTGKKGTTYYYRARVMVYDAQGTLVAKSGLKQCKYASKVK